MCWNTAVRRGRRLRTDLAFRAGLVLDHHRLPISLAITRATVSVAVPGPNGAMMRIGLEGKSCAATGSRHDGQRQ